MQGREYINKQNITNIVLENKIIKNIYIKKSITKNKQFH